MTQPIPFTLHGAHIYAPVKLNGQDSYAFLDTGGSGCRISPTIADGLEIWGESVSTGALGALGEQTTNITEVSSI